MTNCTQVQEDTDEQEKPIRFIENLSVQRSQRFPKSETEKGRVGRVTRVTLFLDPHKNPHDIKDIYQ